MLKQILRPRRGFTLIELLVVIAITLGCHSLGDTYKKLPPAFSTLGGGTGATYHTLLVHLLPYVEQTALYNTPANISSALVPPYQAPSDYSVSDWTGKTAIVGNIRVFSDAGGSAGVGNIVTVTSPMGNNQALHRLQDGTSNIIMFSTHFAVCNGVPTLIDTAPNTNGSPLFGAVDGLFQAAPTVAACNNAQSQYAQGYSSGGISVSLCDGSVRNVSPAITLANWQYALNPNDGNIVNWGD